MHQVAQPARCPPAPAFFCIWKDKSWKISGFYFNLNNEYHAQMLHSPREKCLMVATLQQQYSSSAGFVKLPLNSTTSFYAIFFPMHLITEKYYIPRTSKGSRFLKIQYIFHGPSMPQGSCYGYRNCLQTFKYLHNLWAQIFNCSVFWRRPCPEPWWWQRLDLGQTYPDPPREAPSPTHRLCWRVPALQRRKDGLDHARCRGGVCSFLFKVSHRENMTQVLGFWGTFFYNSDSNKLKALRRAVPGVHTKLSLTNRW